MNIVSTLSLSQKQTKEIRTITNLCRQQNGSILSCPEDGDEFWLLYEGNQNGALGQHGKQQPEGACDMEHGSLQAFFAVYKTEDSCWECYAFTRPDARRQGYFSLLLETVVEKSQEAGEPDLCFVTDNRCGDALKVLEHLEAEFWYDEYMMERRLDRDEDNSLNPLTHNGTGIHIMWEDKESDCELSFFLMNPDGMCGAMVGAASNGTTPAPLPPTGTTPVGGCRLSIHGDSAYLYSLEIIPTLRSRGMGTRFVTEIISLLKKRGCRLLRLQVSGANEPALRLYKKTGFRITETLSYYLY